jgi:hypothetical protein
VGQEHGWTIPLAVFGFSINAARRHLRETGRKRKSAGYLKRFSDWTTVSSFRMTQRNTK